MYPSGRVAPLDTVTPSTGTSRFMRCATIVLLTATTFLALAGCGSSGPDEIGAKIACEDFVQKSLKAPSTADFPSYSSYTATGGPEVWTVNGYVDAENGFGAKIRTDWKCMVSSSDGDSWNLEDLQMP